MTTMNFADILDKKHDDIKRPPLLPIGTYEWQIKKYELDKSNDGKWDMCTFHLTCTDPGDDVDPDALADYGNAAGTYQRLTFMFDTEDKARFEQSEYRLKRFLTDHVKCWDELSGIGLKEALANAVNKRFIGAVRYRSDRQDPDVQYAEIGRTAPLA